MRTRTRPLVILAFYHSFNNLNWLVVVVDGACSALSVSFCKEKENLNFFFQFNYWVAVGEPSQMCTGVK